MTDENCKDCKYLYIPMQDAKILIESNLQFIDELSSQLRLLNKYITQSDSENKHLKERIRELEDELDIHQHHIAELESEEVE